VSETSQARVRHESGTSQARVRHASPLRVPLPQPYDFALSTARFDVYGLDRATVWREGGVHRVFDGREVRIEAAAGGVVVTPHDASIEAQVLRFLGLPFYLDGFSAWAASDDTLARLVAALAGFRPPLQTDPFEALVTSITAQQVSLQSAAAIRSRFIERWGVAHEHAHAFPARERVAQASEDELIGVGFSTRKAEYVLGLARSELDLDALAHLPDEEVTARLVAIRGLGEWTADWFLARHLARPHAWPAGDLGLRKAVAAFYGEVPDLRAFAVRFHPFENLTAHYLLTGLRVAPPA
jgi:DNA-3-methyladenine glycosylase II